MFSFECAALRIICGDNSKEVTPVPIPNTEVKLLSAYDTWWETAWESKTLPFWLKKKFTKVSFFLLYKKKTPRLTRGSVNATHLTKNPPCLRIIMRSANCIKIKKED